MLILYIQSYSTTHIYISRFREPAPKTAGKHHQTLITKLLAPSAAGLSHCGFHWRLSLGATMPEQLEDGTVYSKHRSPLAWIFWLIWCQFVPNIYGIYGSQNDENQEKAKWTKVTYTIGIYSEQNAWPPEINSALSHYQYESEHYVTY